MNMKSIDKLLLTLLLTIGAIVTVKSENYISTQNALNKYKNVLGDKAFLVFPESRKHSLQWFDSIPEIKIEQALSPEAFVLNAQPGEIITFQLGVWALKNDIKNIQIKFPDLKGENGAVIPSGKMTCYNLKGTDFKGQPFSKTLDVSAGRVQALWIGIDLADIAPGKYSGNVSVEAGGKSQDVNIEFNVSGEKVANHGYNEGWRLSRLDWLNSTVGIDENITGGYIPVHVRKHTVSILGRSLEIADNGLPASIVSFFDGSNEKINKQGEPIVSGPFRFIIEKENGEFIRLTPNDLVITAQTPSRVNWKVLNTSPEIDVECSGQMEYDGFVDYKMKLISRSPVKIKDIRLEIPVEKGKADYMMGLGKEGGFRESGWQWKWDASKNQDMLWIGSVNGGIHIKWKAENYVRPLTNIYYEFGRLNMPPSWDNAGKGGVTVSEAKSDVTINAYSGSRELAPGEQLHYDFELLITPLKVIDRQIKYGDRYYHGGGTNTSVKVAAAKKAGANIINIHHAEDIYPFINYPYLDANASELRQLVSDAHAADMRMKFYYTTRELTKNIPEFWALYSLNGEVIYPGPGNASRTLLHRNGPNEWLVKNVREKYIPAWYNPVNEGKFKGETDLSVITTPDSRLNNFYVAGLDWMVQNMQIDGVYIDDSALDRFTLRRARKIIDDSRPEGRMDLHSCNHFGESFGFASCLNMYMDLLPYFDLVWIGEGRDYNREADHWLIEVSGIPFGLTGQMLEGGGNPWRGMVYGITNRSGYFSQGPESLWKFFDDYHFSKREMIGYWDKDCPVTCTNSKAKATAYKGETDVVIAVANWSSTDESTSVVIDWKKLGITPSDYKPFLPEVKGFQEGRDSFPTDTLTLPGQRGYLIVLERK